MRRRLFWKILLGFWLTFFVIVQGTWLLFLLLRPGPDQSDYVRFMSRASVNAAVAAIQRGGQAAFQAEAANWPHDPRRQTVVTPAAQARKAPPPLLEAFATAPDGARYRVAYYEAPHYHGLLDIPREVVIVAAIGGLLFSAVLAWYLTQPVARLRMGFGRLAQGDFTTRLGPAMGRRRDEIADLAHDFDGMAVRLEELVSARDRLLADVSHELRTPLARLTLAIELARQDPARLQTSLERIGREAAKLDEMVGELLTLAKLESGQEHGEEYFNFAAVVKAVVQDANYEASARGVRVTADIDPADETFEWIALGNGRLVARAVENIVRNAVRFSPEGAVVRATLRLKDGTFALAVTDEGPGVPEDSLATLFKPFVQGVSADGFGFGLGLAIAQRAILVHGGTIAARNRSPRGLEIAAALPAAVL